MRLCQACVSHRCALKMGPGNGTLPPPGEFMRCAHSCPIWSTPVGTAVTLAVVQTAKSQQPLPDTDPDPGAQPDGLKNRMAQYPLPKANV